MLHHALTAGSQPAPALQTAVASVQQQGTQSGGACVLPYIFRIAWTVDRVVPNHTISIDAQEDGLGYVSVFTGLALDASPQDDEFEGKYADAGGVGFTYQFRVRIIRTSDASVISELESNVLNETVSDCTI
jgi:hypothetical protein